MAQDSDDCEHCEVTKLTVGVVTGDYREAVHALTHGRYSIPADLHLVGILPGEVAGRSGILLAGQFAEGRTEVLRVPYEALLMAFCHATRCMHEHGLLKHEGLGAELGEMLGQLDGSPKEQKH